VPAFLELESAIRGSLASTTPPWPGTQPLSERGMTKVLLDSLIAGHNSPSNRFESGGGRICKRGQDLVPPRNENGNVVKEKLIMLFRRFVLFARSVDGKFGKAVNEKLVMLSCRPVVFTRTARPNGPNNDIGKLRLKLEWPYVMNSSVAMHRPPVSGTWIWHRQHARWHHRHYRTRR
jgi:hypothetical protein